MKIKDEPLDLFEAALADIAEVPDWRAVWGPDHGGGPDALTEIRERVQAATGWTSEPVDGGADMRQTGWSFTTTRGVGAAVWADGLSFSVTGAGWSAYELTAEEYSKALAILQHEQRPRHLELFRKHLGEPVYAASCVDPGFPGRWRDEYPPDEYGYLAVWERPGLEVRLYAQGAGLTFDPQLPGMSIYFAVAAAGDGR